MKTPADTLFGDVSFKVATMALGYDDEALFKLGEFPPTFLVTVEPEITTMDLKHALELPIQLSAALLPMRVAIGALLEVTPKSEARGAAAEQQQRRRNGRVKNSRGREKPYPKEMEKVLASSSSSARENPYCSPCRITNTGTSTYCSIN